MSQRDGTSPTPITALPVQRGIWITERSGTAAYAFHMGLEIRFAGAPDPAALAEACAAVVARHDILRLAAAERDGELVLVPAAHAPALVHSDYHGTLRRDTIAEPFDLRLGPLVRFVATTLPSGQHVLLVAAHHLVFDGLSKAILVRELAAAYTAAVATSTAAARATDPTTVTSVEAGTDPSTGRLVDCRAAVAAQRDEAARQAAAAGEYWATRWREPGKLLLPRLRQSALPEPESAASPRGACQLTLGADLAAALEQTADKLGVTRFELLLTAVQILLHRYGNAHPVVAVDMSTRTAATAGSIGPYVNELPVAAPKPDGATVRSYAIAVRSAMRELYPIRAVPLAQAVPGLRPRAALAPVSLSYRRQEEPDPAFADLATEVGWLAAAQSPRCDLQIQAVDRGSEILLSLHCPLSATDPASVVSLGVHLRSLLTAMTSDVDAPVSRLPMLAAQERHRLLTGWNGTARDYPAQATVVAMFRRQAQTTPRRTAVVSAGRRWSYADLAAEAGELAHLLRQRGVQPGDLVAVCLERSVDLLATLLATAMVGAAYLPVDPAYPAARRRLVLADARPALLVTTAALGSEADAAATATLTLDADRGAPADAGPAVDLPRPDDLAYVIYTSGSTGAPKGVAVSHRALANLLLSMAETLAPAPGSVWLAHTSVSFDISALELFLPLTCGGTVVLATAAESSNAAAMLRLIRDGEVTHVQATPSGWRMLLDAGFTRAATPGRGVVALCGGETLPLPLAARLRAQVGRLVNVYGPTETTIWSTLAELPDPVTEVTIGRPIANTQVYVCDDELNPLPAGLPGELHIAGAGLAAGYYGRPDLTAERFVDNPFGPPGSRLYRTGDRVSWGADGQLIHHGRVDTQVKVHGHRVELGEVEARLLEHPAVAAAAVALYTDARGLPSLAGHLALRPDAARPEPAELRALLGRTMPAAMVPTAWVVHERLPLTPNGKLDRAALPAPAVAPAGPADGTGEDDTSPVVRRLRAMWGDALSMPDVGLHEDLFDLGGHSLTVIALVDRILAEFGVEVSLDAFYDTPTIAGVAEVVERLTDADKSDVDKSDVDKSDSAKAVAR